MESIVFSSVDSPIKIHPAITINDDYNSYRIDTKERPVSILTLKSTKFIALYHDGVIHIFNLETDMKFPDDFKAYIESIKDKLIKYFDFTYKSSIDHTREIKKQISDYKTARELQEQIINDGENKYEFVPIGPGSDNCVQRKEFDLANAKRQIEELNVLLKETCPDFYLHIDYLTSFPENSNIHLFSRMLEYLNSFYTYSGIVLCLFTGNQCVSSIDMHFTSYSLHLLYIDSVTILRYERRKFNKLLRAVAIIISKEINEKIDTLKSIAQNSLSAQIMINSFNAQCYDKQDNLISKFTNAHLIPRVLNIPLLTTYVQLTPENIENAKRVFMEIITTEDRAKRIKCDKLQDETAVPVEAATAPPLAPADAHIAHPLDPAAAPPLDPAAAPPLDPAAALTITPPPLPPQPPSRSNYYRTLGIPPRVPRGGKQTKKRSNHKRSNHKRSNHKRSNHKRSNHKRSNHKRSNHKRSGHKRTYKLK
jgi:hypothetical protein